MAKNERPRLSMVALVHRDGEILAGARRHGPGKGQFVLPGGGVEFGESMAHALMREVKEETGLDVTIDDPTVLATAELIGKKAHRVLLVLAATPADKKEPEDTDELEDVHFIGPEEMADLFAEGRVQRWTIDVLRAVGLIPVEQ